MGPAIQSTKDTLMPSSSIISFLEKEFYSLAQNYPLSIPRCVRLWLFGHARTSILRRSR